ncbi:MAG TPA: hypothetical protein VL178_13390 [Pseudomonas sp.]|nr:hypothetical protein [Pseudomonas sp.]
MAVLDFPGVLPASCEFRLQSNSQSFESELSGATQVAAVPGARWAASLRFPILQGDNARLMRAFLARLGGRAGMFRMSVLEPNAGTAIGSPEVSSVVSRVELETEGWTPSQPLALEVGDYIAIGNELKMITEPAVADAFGRATLHIAPPMRRNPAVGTPVVVDKPSCVMRLADDRAAWGISAPSLYAMSFDCIEVLDV